MKSKLFIIGAVIFASYTYPVYAEKKQGFIPDISLILDGRYGRFSDASDYELPGFMLGGEAARGEEGFHIGHNELLISANIDDMFYGKLTTAIAEHEGATEVELEEAFIETLSLAGGVAIRGGRFFSEIGYLNSQHGHVWDFADAPLIYRGLFGNQLIDDGLQLSWVAPADFYFKLGVEGLRGERFPAGGATHRGSGASTAFLKLGGDVGASHAWQLGLSHWRADVVGRTSGAHAHDATEIPAYTGESEVSGVDFVWKWAPDGNSRETSFKIQGEYFERSEEGDVELAGSLPLETTSYIGEQSGWYAQMVYQFMPRWRIGYRYDRLKAENTGSDELVLEEAGLDDEGHRPERTTVMLDYSYSEYSRIRVQYARDNSFETKSNLALLQYVVTLGAHGAHKF